MSKALSLSLLHFVFLPLTPFGLSSGQRVYFVYSVHLLTESFLEALCILLCIPRFPFRSDPCHIFRSHTIVPSRILAGSHLSTIIRFIP
ncbi:hypothetical protein BDV34DRAFT_194138 [Aspergillus parasiticus]|uniref:Secreted protein n=1 Tax=Aspergillus parasiticus TaxID=5067 RepID=A0A5N6DMS5_ASPPA|nr:hypothetical protein BDV34DRAFT_194138 [Aspergillus parasiticus]